MGSQVRAMLWQDCSKKIAPMTYDVASRESRGLWGERRRFGDYTYAKRNTYSLHWTMVESPGDF
jgi:hypothetical protein